MVYTAVPIALTDLQLKKLHSAQKNKQSITLKLSNNTNIPNTQVVELKLTDNQIKKLNKAGNKLIHITFSVTQLKHQGAGIWDAVMKLGRFIGRAGTKIASSSVGKVIKSVAAPVMSGLVESGVSYGLTKALNKRDEEAQQSGAPSASLQLPQQAQQAEAAPQQGSALYRTGQRGSALYRTGQRGSSLYRTGQPGYGINDIATLLNVMPKLLLKKYKNITNNELQTLFSTLLDLEHKNLLPKALPEKVKNDIKLQKGGFLQFLAPILAGIAGPLLGNLFGGQRGNGIKEL